MKRNLLVIIIALITMPMHLFADSYTSLWKQVTDAEQNDLPRSAMATLMKIIEKAEAEKSYGNLLKAELKHAQWQTAVAPDSMIVEMERLTKQEEKARQNDKVLAAVYQTVLGRIHSENHVQEMKSEEIAKEYFRQAMQYPALLAKQKAAAYAPLVETGYDSRWFNDDLLHVIGYETRDFETLSNYYKNTDLRTAACISALELARQRKDYCWTVAKSKYVRELDSLLNEYGDIRIAGEVAIARYDFMARASDVNVEEKMNYINYALMKWGEWPRMNVLRNAQKDLTRPMFGVIVKRPVIASDTPSAFMISQLRNLTELTMTITRVGIDGSKDYDLDDEKVYAAVKKTAMPLNQIRQTKKYVGLPDYFITEKDSFNVPGLPVGIYLVEFTTDNKNIGVKRELLYVTDLYVLCEEYPGNQIRYAVVNYKTGQPVPGAKLRLQSRTYRDKRLNETITMDEKGEKLFTYPELLAPNNVWPYTEKEKSCPNSSLWNSFRFYENSRTSTIGKIFTDRSIYRPGQTVHASLLVFMYSPNNVHKVVSDRTVVLVLRDANGKQVGEKQVVTDSYGAASCDFELPTSGLTGQFRIDAKGLTSSYFSVEEYKRPTFTVEFPEINEHYANGDTVVVLAHAKTYAGVPVQGAQVKYKVTRQQARWWWRYSNSYSSDSEIMAEGETVTDNNGGFEIEIPMILPQGISNNIFYNFTAEAEVVDVGGESHSGSLTLPLGLKPTSFVCNLPEQIERDSLKTITFGYYNAAGKEIDGQVKYYLDGSTRAYTAKTNVETVLDNRFHELSSGKHQLKAFCGTDTVECNFVVFSMNDKRPCIETHDWFYVTEETFRNDGKSIYVQFGSSDKDVHVFYSIVAGDNVLESGSLDLDNVLETRSFTYKEEYEDGIVLNYAWVKGCETYFHNVTLKKPLPDKRLLLNWTTFRDRLTPGQKEEWTLRVNLPDGSPAEAQLVATLYDKSLDQIKKHDWSFSVPLSQAFPNLRWIGIQFNEDRWVSGAARLNYLKTQELSLSHFSDDLFNLYGAPIGYLGMGEEVQLSSSPKRMARASVDAEEAKMKMPNVMEDSSVADSEDKEDTTKSSDQVRENLNETAFFYPALETDSKGNIVIKFTLPESVTTWKFMGLAHDKNMNFGGLNSEAVAKKDVMIQPNMPRFLRTGDKATIAARLFNTSEKAASGTATMLLIDPETEKTMFTQSRNFSVNAGETGSVAFDFQPDGSTPIYICKIIASGKTFSDGEQHYLPILPDKELVTNTYPFTQHEAGTKTIDLSKLFAVSDKSNKLTVEYTNNPAWLMIQAMPTYSSPWKDDVISQATSYYVNSIGNNIMHQSPKIETVVNQWREEMGSETSLMSSLEKNQDVKNLVLNETPWVLDADNEASQKRSLIKFFDKVTIDMRIKSAIDKMKKLQNGDGSWSWWPGMDGSIYMTTAVSEMLVRLNKMIGVQNDTDTMLSSAFKYMGYYLVEEYKEMKIQEKKNVKNIRPSETAIQILYLNALDGRKLDRQTQTASDYMVDLLAKKGTEFTIYGKAVSAIILAKNGERNKANTYLQSIREYTVYTDEMGRYFDTPKAYYSWCDYRIPTEVAAIEAIKELQPEDRKAVEEMQRWLLQEKRTQAWDTPVNCTDAIYAFLDGNMQKLDDQSPAKLSVNGKPLVLPQATAGLGYVKTSMTGSDMRTFTAEKTSEDTSWGAVYAQFMQKTSDISGASSGITVTREIINANQPLKVGDKVKVKITIKADRDYDFVQVVDKRAACLEPVKQLSGYHWGYYIAPRDNTTSYYFDRMAKGTHVVETEYYIDRVGTYETGTCTVQCAYAPEYSGRAGGKVLEVRP